MNLKQSAKDYKKKIFFFIQSNKSVVVSKILYLSKLF
jgi:hypothetical protein